MLRVLLDLVARGRAGELIDSVCHSLTRQATKTTWPSPAEALAATTCSEGELWLRDFEARPTPLVFDQLM